MRKVVNYILHRDGSRTVLKCAGRMLLKNVSPNPQHQNPMTCLWDSVVLGSEHIVLRAEIPQTSRPNVKRETAGNSTSFPAALSGNGLRGSCKSCRIRWKVRFPRTKTEDKRPFTFSITKNRRGMISYDAQVFFVEEVSAIRFVSISISLRASHPGSPND